MRVILVGVYPPPYGGLQTNLVAIRDHLRRKGHGCAVINISRYRRPGADEVYYPKTGLGVLWLLWRLPADIIHLHIGGSPNWRLLALCFVSTLLPGKRTVLSFHSGGYPSSPQGRSARYLTLRGWILRRLDGVIAVNQEIVDLFRRFGVRAGRVRLIHPHAIPAAPGQSALPEPMRRFYDGHRPVLLTVGLLEPEYDLGLQIEALGAIQAEFPGAGLVIVGSGSLEQELRDRIARQPWSRHILLCGDVPHPATLRAIVESQVLLRTTLYDGDAISIREALHFGTPVVGTENGMRPEGVHRIPIGDRAALVSTVTRMLRSGGNAPARDGSGEENLQAVLDLYQEVLGG